MRDQLTEFLEAVAARPFQWGEDDCSLFMADWWWMVHGEDPAARVRGSYGSEEECHAMLRREGGLIELASSMARAAGMAHAVPVGRADFGIIGVGSRIAGGICCGEFWAVRNEGVGFVAPSRVLKAWAI